jgi:citrate lyase subunit beta/citryl-CoA lyase
VTGRFPRSFLFVPGNRERFVESAWRSAAEAIVFDLEDSVAPDQKAAAREAVRAIVSKPRAGAPPLFVRVNAPGRSDLAEDVRALAGAPVAGLVIPKAESAAAIEDLVAETGGLPLVLLLETPRAVLRALDLGEAAGRSLAALGFGAEDFRAAMGVDAAEFHALLAFALPAVAIAAAALDVPAIDAPEMDFANADRLRARAAAARSVGFRAKFAIHPVQVPIIHEAFAHSPAERLWAERVTRAYEQGVAAGHGSVRVEGRVVDTATIRRARQILDESQI